MARIDMRAWSLDADDYEDEASFRAAVQTELAMSEYLGFRLGVAVVSAPIRREVSPDVWVVVGWTFRTATVPGIRLTSRGDVSEVVDEAAEAVLEPDEDEPVVSAAESADVSY